MSGVARGGGLVGRAGIATGTLAVVRLTGAVGGILTARLLGPAGKGAYAVLFTLGLIVGSVAAAGLEFWVAREIARGGPWDRVRSVVRSHLALMTLVLVLLGALLGTLAVGAGVASAGEVVGVVALAVGTGWFVVLVAIPLGLQQMRGYAVGHLAASVVYLAGVVALIVFDEAVVALVLGAAALGRWVGVGLVYSRHRLGRARYWDGYRKALRFALPAGLGTLFELATYRVDILVLAALSTTTDVGLYSVAVAYSEVLWLIPNAVSHVLVPHAAETPDPQSTARVTRTSVLVTAATGALLALIGSWLLPLLFGDDFSDAASAVPFLVLAAVLLSLWKLITAYLVAVGRSSAKATTAMTGAVLMLGMDFVLIPRMGIVGAAAASALGYLVAAGHAIVLFNHASGGRADLLVRVSRRDITEPARQIWNALVPGGRGRHG